MKKDLLNYLWIIISTTSIVFTLSFFIFYCMSERPVFTDDYKNENEAFILKKVDQAKDSIIKYRAKGENSIANKYTDTLNNYAHIYNYLIK